MPPTTDRLQQSLTATDDRCAFKRLLQNPTRIEFLAGQVSVSQNDCSQSQLRPFAASWQCRRAPSRRHTFDSELTMQRHVTSAKLPASVFFISDVSSGFDGFAFVLSKLNYRNARATSPVTTRINVVDPVERQEAVLSQKPLNVFSR